MSPSLERACALAAEGRWDEAARALSGGRCGMDPGALLRNDPRNDLMYSELPRTTAASPSELARWKRLAAREGRAELWALAGAGEAAAGRLGPALESLGRALRAGPGLDETRLLRAAARLLYGGHDRHARTKRWLLGAVEDLDRFVGAHPEDARGRRLRAEARKELQDYDGAAVDLEAAIRLDPGDGWAYAELAELHCDAGRSGRAAELIAVLERRHAGEGWFWALKARALAASGRDAASLAALDKAVELSPRAAPIIGWRGEALRRAGRAKEALEAFARSLELAPEFVYSYEWRGRLYLALERYPEALADLDEVVRRDGRHFSGRVMRGEAFFKLGDFRRAAADFDAVYPLDPRTTWTPRAGEARPPGPREPEYWSDLDAAVAARPGDPWPRALRGRALAIVGRLPEALEDLRSAAALPYGRAWLGFALVAAGDAAGALSALRSARGRWAAAWRGRALAALGRHAEAVAEFDRALAKEDSLLAQVHEWKAAALAAAGASEAAAAAKAAAGRWRGLTRGEEGRRAAAPAAAPADGAAALAGRGLWAAALSRLAPGSAARLPGALSDFYTFVGEDDLLEGNPLLRRPGRADLLAWRRGAAALPPGDGLREGLLAYALLAVGRPREAADWAEQCLQLRPGDGRAAALCGAAWWLRGDRERTKRWVPRAWRRAEQAVALGESGRDALLLRAQVRFEFDDHDGALADLDAILKGDPADDRVRVGKVDKLLDMGLYDDALREMAVLLRRHPKAWWAHAQRGRVLAFAGRGAESLVEFERARRLNPRSGAVLTWKAEALRRLGRLAEARACLERSKRLQPRYSLTWEQSGRLRLVEGDLAAAWRELDRACRLDPVRSLSFAWRGEAAFKRGRFAQAWADFERAAPLEPRTTWTAPDSGRPASAAQREFAFWSDLDKAVDGGGRAWPRVLRGRFLVTMGRERDALADLTAAAGDPRAAKAARAAALAWRGRALLRLGAPARALEDLDASLALRPGAARPGAWRAEALLALGREPDALAQLDAALERPERALGEAYLTRAALHERSGRLAPARADYETAFSLDGTSERAREGLARLGDRGA